MKEPPESLNRLAGRGKRSALREIAAEADTSVQLVESRELRLLQQASSQPRDNSRLGDKGSADSENQGSQRDRDHQLETWQRQSGQPVDYATSWPSFPDRNQEQDRRTAGVVDYRQLDQPNPRSGERGSTKEGDSTATERGRGRIESSDQQRDKGAQRGSAARGKATGVIGSTSGAGVRSSRDQVAAGVNGLSASTSASMSSGAPCGACKFLRRKCVRGCIFAPYFGADQGAARFAAVHKIFGASNVAKLLLHIPMPRRCDAVLTISYEAQARLSDPVYGCVATIFALQQQVIPLLRLFSVPALALAMLPNPKRERRPSSISPEVCTLES